MEPTKQLDTLESIDPYEGTVTYANGRRNTLGGRLAGIGASTKLKALVAMVLVVGAVLGITAASSPDVFGSASAAGSTGGTPRTTQSPTSAPTVSTDAPSNSPSASPTYQTTGTPTSSPTRRTTTPVGSNTKAPVGSNTKAPVGSHTKAPHSTPTNAPHGTHTKAPHGTHTKAPHIPHSKAPHPAPGTNAPHSKNTKAPTSKNTKAPTSRPSVGGTPLDTRLYVNPQDSWIAKCDEGEDGLTYFGGPKSYYGIPIAIENVVVTPSQLDNVPDGEAMIGSLIRTNFDDLFASALPLSLVRSAYAGNTTLTFTWETVNETVSCFFLTIATAGGTAVVNTNKTYVDSSIIGIRPPYSNKKFNYTCEDFVGFDVDTENPDSEVLGVYMKNNTQSVRPAINTGYGFHHFFFPQCAAPVNEAGWYDEMKKQSGLLIEFTCAQLNYLESLFVGGVSSEIADLLNMILDAGEASASLADIESLLDSWRFACAPQTTTLRRQLQLDGVTLPSFAPGDLLPKFDNPTVGYIDLFDEEFDQIEAVLTAAGRRLLKSLVKELVDAAGVGTSDSCVTGVIKTLTADIEEEETAQCNGLTVAGNDQPDIQRIELGTSEGTFDFTYQTFFVRDQIDIRHGPNLIFTTGCVGFSETVQVTLSDFPSSEIVVEVTPNCAGSSGTAWNYVVGCPSGAELQCKSPNPLQTRCECAATDGSIFQPSPIDPSRPVETNGCGSDVRPLPCGLPNAGYAPAFSNVFTGICNTHDTCYGTCGQRRDTCDNILCAATQTECLSNGGGSECDSAALISCAAVRFGGRKAYVDAQRKYCDCDTPAP